MEYIERLPFAIAFGLLIGVVVGAWGIGSSPEKGKANKEV